MYILYSEDVDLTSYYLNKRKESKNLLNKLSNLETNLFNDLEIFKTLETMPEPVTPDKNIK